MKTAIVRLAYPKGRTPAEAEEYEAIADMAADHAENSGCPVLERDTYTLTIALPPRDAWDGGNAAAYVDALLPAGYRPESVTIAVVEPLCDVDIVIEAVRARLMSNGIVVSDERLQCIMAIAEDRFLNVFGWIPFAKDSSSQSYSLVERTEGCLINYVYREYIWPICIEKVSEHQKK